jgi:uncharacterized RDD family membrane protein YckC/ribosomal protein L40E
VDASAAQNSSVTKTCLQCGAVLPSSARACNFCDSSFAVDFSSAEKTSDRFARKNSSLKTDPGSPRIERFEYPEVLPEVPEADPAWRGELAQRLEAYRSRRRKLSPNANQSKFSFEQPPAQAPPQTAVAMAEPPATVEDDFAFTIAIGRPSRKHVSEDTNMVIDVSLPAGVEGNSQTLPAEEGSKSQPGMHPVASIDDRRLAALIDLGCLLFAYGGFLMLFGSLGGQFTLDKLSAAVYAASFATVYVQYFALFTVFGGTTPGMMMRNLQVVSFSGEPPTPRQMLLRSAGYILSAGTFFLGFLWALWDEDELTWHDRLSHTYLAVAETFVDAETSTATHSR